jgi:hypothetical protein
MSAKSVARIFIISSKGLDHFTAPEIVDAINPGGADWQG